MRQDNVTAHKGAEVTKALEGHQRRASGLFRALSTAARLWSASPTKSKHGITMVGRTSSSGGRGWAAAAVSARKSSANTRGLNS
jgi:hypothetical protein